MQTRMDNFFPPYTVTRYDHYDGTYRVEGHDEAWCVYAWDDDTSSWEQVTDIAFTTAEGAINYANELLDTQD